MFPVCQRALLFGNIWAGKVVLPISSQTQTPDETEEIQAVLSSQTFSEAPTLARLLKYLCRNHFSEDKRDLNEYRIGVEALGRSPDFDPARNSCVRVEMHRLRGRLRKYYETEGADHNVRIILMDGRYGLQFVRRSDGYAAASRGANEFTAPGEESGVRITARPLPDQGTAVANHLRDLERSRIFHLSTKSVVLAATVVVALAAAGWMSFGAWSRWRLAHTSVAASPSAPGVAIAATAENGFVLILAGNPNGKYVDRDGKIWGGDRYFTGGEAVELKVPYIQGTADPTIYRTARIGEFRYDIPVKPGVYELRLHFVETTFGPGTFNGRGESSRVFSVYKGEQPLLMDFDILSDAGGPYRAFTRVFKGISASSDGMIHLKFLRMFDQPFVNAIELAPEAGGRMNPERIVMQENSYVDHAGRFWGSDQYAIGGILASHQSLAETDSDAHLLDGERFGHFTYMMPVAPGHYTVTLHFTEAYFGTKEDVWGYRGREFDVYANGLALLRNFNILAKARESNKPVTETFHGIEPNAAGQIVLSFVPVKNYACVSAIEVTDDSQ
jgi:hypothetical protein